jgi:hypothetical protein
LDAVGPTPRVRAHAVQVRLRDILEREAVRWGWGSCGVSQKVPARTAARIASRSASATDVGIQ